MADGGYWPSVYGKAFCALFGKIGHDWVPVIRGVGLDRTYYGQQCRRCWRTEDCPCLGCAHNDGSPDA